MIRGNYWIRSTICALLVIIVFSSVSGADWKEDIRIGEIFKAAGMDGTFVLYDVTAKAYTGYNKVRAEKLFVPASTFKIPNSLIGLSVGAVKSVDEVLPYKGHPKPFTKAWEKDMGLREAIVVSNVPIYQELARRIGLDCMRDNVAKMDYGNKEIGASVDTFWLTGPLKITAIEQTQFLARLAQGTLPFPEEFQRSIREITQLEKGPNWTLHGKTGWENGPDPGVGWWVGWVQKEGRIYAFALNIDIKRESDGAKRIGLGKASLKALGII
jgi:beta-lactamase class D